MAQGQNAGGQPRQQNHHRAGFHRPQFALPQGAVKGLIDDAEAELNHNGGDGKPQPGPDGQNLILKSLSHHTPGISRVPFRARHTIPCIS